MAELTHTKQKNKQTNKQFLDSFPWFVAKKRPNQQIYSTWCVVRQSLCLSSLQSSFVIWTLLRSSFTGCNPELAILSTLKLLYCINCSFDGDLFLSRGEYQFLQLDLILLVPGFGNGSVLRPLQEKRNPSDAWYITATLRNRMREKPLRYLRK